MRPIWIVQGSFAEGSEWFDAFLNIHAPEVPAQVRGATGYGDQLVTRPLPVRLDGLHVGMLWHVRNDRSSAHQWLRARLLEAAAAKRGVRNCNAA